MCSRQKAVQKSSKFTRFVNVGSLDDMFDFLGAFSLPFCRHTQQRVRRGKFPVFLETGNSNEGSYREGASMQPSGGPQGLRQQRNLYYLLLLGLLDPLLLVFLDLDVQALAMHF